MLSICGVGSLCTATLPGAFVRSFIREALSDGTVPLVAFSPVEDDLSPEKNHIPLGIKILHEAGLAYTDLSSCLSDVPSSALGRKWLPGHYSQSANNAAATCIRQAIEGLPDKGGIGANR